MTDIKDKVTEQGQPYWDKPIYLAPQRGVRDAVRKAFGQQAKLPILAGHERVKLVWLQPDGNGGLIPAKTIRNKNVRAKAQG